MIFGFFTLFFLVPTASWGPEHEDQEVLGTQDLKSYILGLPVISDSKVTWGFSFKSFESPKFTVIDTSVRASERY